jgi:HSP90 family molecular chaperone
MKNWTKEERALLAHLVSTYLEKSDNILEACEFASKKLGRSKAACYAQYHNKMRNKSLSDFALTTEQEEELMQGSDYDIDKEKPSEILEAIDFLNSILSSNNIQNEPQRDPEITVYSGFKQHCTIVTRTEDIIVAEFGGSIITIKL